MEITYKHAGLPCYESTGINGYRHVKIESTQWLSYTYKVDTQG